MRSGIRTRLVDTRCAIVVAAWALLVPTLACGAPAATTPAAPGSPRAAVLPALISGTLETDVEIARAIRANYTKYETLVPMRDGTRLFTVSYVPKDARRRYPILMTRTPYSVGPYGVDSYPDETNPRMLHRFSPSLRLLREGYIFVHQDVRGRMMSEGTFVDVRPLIQAGGTDKFDESTDAWDTIDWLVRNLANNNGRVGIWGISYPGFYAAQAAVNSHPALKAVSPQAPVTEWFLGDDFHHNGAFFLSDSFDFYFNFGKPRPTPTSRAVEWQNLHEGRDAYDFFLELGPISNANEKYMKHTVGFWEELMKHSTRDAFWKARDPRPFYRNSTAAIMTVGGFFDAEDLWGALETYRSFETQGPKSENLLVMGPWRHGGWARHDGDRLGDITFGQKTSVFYRDEIEAAFFSRHLYADTPTVVAPQPEAWIFETGTNVWRTYPAWPPPESKKQTWYFSEHGKLIRAPARASGAGSVEEADSYASDPSKPVPYRSRPADHNDGDYMTDDQRFASKRPDVLVYSTEALTEDLALAGPIDANLWVSVTGTDADFIVKIIDVWPSEAKSGSPLMGGYQQLVRAEVMRGKFRRSFEHPEPFVPNEPTQVAFRLPDVAHAFRPGHRLMIQVQSSWFPLVDRNPQTFVDIPSAKETDFRAATHRVFRSALHPSGVTITLRKP